MRSAIWVMGALLMCAVPAAAAGNQAKPGVPAAPAIPEPMTRGQLGAFMASLKTNVAAWQQVVGSADIAKLHGAYPAGAGFGKVVEATRQACLEDLDDLAKVVGNLSSTNLLLNVDVSELLPQLRGHLVVLVVNLQIYNLYVRETGGAAAAQDEALLKKWSVAIGGARNQVDDADAQFAGHMEGLTLSVMKECNLEEHYPNCDAAVQPAGH